MGCDCGRAGRCPMGATPIASRTCDCGSVVHPRAWGRCTSASGTSRTRQPAQEDPQGGRRDVSMQAGAAGRQRACRQMAVGSRPRAGGGRDLSRSHLTRARVAAACLVTAAWNGDTAWKMGTVPLFRSKPVPVNSDRQKSLPSQAFACTQQGVAAIGTRNGGLSPFSPPPGQSSPEPLVSLPSRPLRLGESQSHMCSLSSLYRLSLSHVSCLSRSALPLSRTRPTDARTAVDRDRAGVAAAFRDCRLLRCGHSRTPGCDPPCALWRVGAR